MKKLDDLSAQIKEMNEIIKEMQLNLKILKDRAE